MQTTETNNVVLISLSERLPLALYFLTIGETLLTCCHFFLFQSLKQMIKRDVYGPFCLAYMPILL